MKRGATLGLMLPYVALLGCFLIIPMLALLRVSFAAHAISSITGAGLTLANYRAALGRYDLRIILTTVRLAATSTVIAAVLAYPPAYLLGRARGAAKSALSLAIMIPFMTGAVIKVLGWYIVLEPGGLLNAALGALGVGRSRLLGSDAGVLIGLVEFALPLMIFTLAAAIEHIAPMLEEAAINLGATPIRVLFMVILPLTRTGLLSGAMLCFGVSASAYVVPLVLGGSRVRTVAIEIYDQVLVAFDWPNAAALSMIVVAVLGSLGYAAACITRDRRS